MKTSRDPRFINLVTWAVSRGAKLFSQVRVTDDGLLMTTKHIPAQDIVLAVPDTLTFSLLDVGRTPDVPQSLRVSPKKFAAPLPWWPSVNWGTFSFIAHCTRVVVTPDADHGRSAHLNTLIELGAFDSSRKDPAPALLADAMKASGTKAFGEAIDPLLQLTGTDRDTFTWTFCRMYCAVRRLGLPLWNESRQGSQLIAQSPYGAATAPAGDILGATPFIDQVRHSSSPNVSVGTPSAEAQEWMVLNLGTKPGAEYMVLQAGRAILPGEVLTMDRNLSFGFDDQQFASWFGEPYDPSKIVPSAEKTTTVHRDVKPEVTTDDIFF